MPTYKNSAAGYFEYVYLDGRKLLAGAGETFQSYLVYDDVSGMVRTDGEPYYNPIQMLEQLHGSSGSAISVSVCADCQTLDIFDVACATGVTVYLESSGNLPALHVPLTSSENLSLGMSNKARNLVMVFEGGGTVWIKQSRE